jgi:hypothetical protein
MSVTVFGHLSRTKIIMNLRIVCSDMIMEEMGDGMDELWWSISFGVVYMDLMDGGSV